MHSSHTKEVYQSLLVLFILTGLSLALVIANSSLDWNLSIGLEPSVTYILFNILIIAASLHVFAIVWHTRQNTFKHNPIILALAGLVVSCLFLLDTLLYIYSYPMYSFNKTYLVWSLANVVIILALFKTWLTPWHVNLTKRHELVYSFIGFIVFGIALIIVLLFEYDLPVFLVSCLQLGFIIAYFIVGVLYMLDLRKPRTYSASGLATVVFVFIIAEALLWFYWA